MRYISQGRLDVLPQCPRKYYLSYHMDGVGYESTRTNWDLWVGLATHKGLETLLNHGLDAAEVAIISYPPFSDPVADDDGRRIALGLVVAWALHRMPSFLERFEVERVEYKVELPLTPSLRLIGRIDVCVKDKESGVRWAFNFKTTNALKDWIMKFAYDIQAWTEALAYEQEIGQEVQGVIYEALYKGGQYVGRPTSPLVRHGSGKTAVQVPLASIRAHVESLPDLLCLEQFDRSLPTFKDTQVVEEWLDELIASEADVDYVLTLPIEDQLRYFKRRRSTINCRWCAFEGVCWRNLAVKDLVETKKLRKRETPITQANQEEGNAD